MPTPRPGPTESVLVLLPLRLVLGGLFCLAAYKKLGDPQSFAEAIKGFRIVSETEHAHLIVSAAFVIPWVEMLAGLGLILGLWTRASAAAIGLALLAFIAGLVSVMARGLDANCSCFGDLSLVCPATVGWCQVVRNLVLLVPAGLLVWRGGGVVGLDALLDGRGRDADGSGGVDGPGGRA